MRSRYVPEAVLAATEPSDTSSRPSPLSWSGDTLVLRRIEHRPDRTLNTEERWTLDESGRTLSRFQRVVDGPRRSQQTLVFTRP